MAVGVEIDLLVVGDPEPLEGFLARAGPGDAAAEEPADRRALRAAETRVAPGDHVRRDPALPVGRSGQRDQAPLAGHEVLDLDGVADREDVRIARAHLVVDLDAAALAEGQPGRLRQIGIGTHAERDDHHVGRMNLARLRFDLERVVGRLAEFLDAVAERELDAVHLQMAADEPGVFRIERGHHLVEHLHDRDVEPEMAKVLGGLQPDETSADHDRLLGRTHHLNAGIGVHAGQVGRTLFDPFADRPRVGHGPDLEDAGKVDAGKRRANRLGPGRKHQLVVALGRHFAGQRVAQIDGLGLGVDRHGLAVRARVDVELLMESALAGDQQARLVLDDAADVIGQAAVGVGHVGAALDHEDLGGLVQPAQSCRAGRASGDASDDDDFHSGLLGFTLFEFVGSVRRPLSGGSASAVAISFSSSEITER